MPSASTSSSITTNSPATNTHNGGNKPKASASLSFSAVSTPPTCHSVKCRLPGLILSAAGGEVGTAC